MRGDKVGAKDVIYLFSESRLEEELQKAKSPEIGITGGGEYRHWANLYARSKSGLWRTVVLRSVVVETS